MSDFLVLASLDIRKWCLAGASYAHQWKPRQKDKVVGFFSYGYALCQPTATGSSLLQLLQPRVEG